MVRFAGFVSDVFAGSMVRTLAHAHRAHELGRTLTFARMREPITDTHTRTCTGTHTLITHMHSRIALMHWHTPDIRTHGHAHSLTRSRDVLDMHTHIV